MIFTPIPGMVFSDSPPQLPVQFAHLGGSRAGDEFHQNAIVCIGRKMTGLRRSQGVRSKQPGQHQCSESEHGDLP